MIASSSHRHTSRPTMARLMAVFLLFLLLGLVYTWPLARWMFDAIPYGYDADPAYALAPLYEGDHLQYFYHLGLLTHAVQGDIPWFSNPLEFATPWQPTIGSDYGLPMALLYLPFALVSLPFGYNVYLLFSYGLCGVAVFLFGYQLTKSEMAGLAAALVFNFFPLRQVELLGGHPSGFALFLFPLALYFFDRAVESRSLCNSAMGGLCAIALTYQYNYFTYYLMMFLMAYIPWRLGPAMIQDWRRGTINRLGLAAVPYALGMLVSLKLMLRFSSVVKETTSFGGGRSLDEVALFSPPLNALWDTSSTFAVYIGLPLIAALFGLFRGLFVRRAEEPCTYDLLFFTAAFGLAYALAFGTSLSPYLPLYDFFYNHFPYFNFSRSPVKIMIIAITALAALVAFMTAWIVRRKKRKPLYRMVGALLLVGVIVDYHPGKAIGLALLDEGNKTYQRMVASKPTGPILNLPVWPGEASWESIYQYYAVQSGLPMINGYSPLVTKDHIKKVFTPLFSMNSGDVSERQVALLRKLKVSYIVLHTNAFPSKVSAYSPYFTLERLLASPYLELVEAAEPLWVFKLTTPLQKKRQVAAPVGIFYQAEYLHRLGGALVEDKDATNGKALMGAQEGILNAGPYQTIPAGNYIAIIRAKVKKRVSSPALKIDIASDQGRTVPAEMTLRGTDFHKSGVYEEFRLPFTLPVGPGWQIETRTYGMSDRPVWIDWIQIVTAAGQKQTGHFEAERLRYYTGRLVADAKASGGKTMRALPGIQPPAEMVFGPDRLYDAGNYRATLRLRTEGGIMGNKPVGDVTVIALGSGGATLMQREIGPTELNDDYRDITIDFRLEKRDVVRVTLAFDATAPLLFDTLTIERRSGNE